MRLYLNDSFMIRKIIVAAVPAALLAMAGALSSIAPANAQFFDNPVTRATSGTPGAGTGGTTNPSGANIQQTPPAQASTFDPSRGGGFGGALLTTGSFTMMAGSGGF